MTGPCKTRFAPSPTGLLHVGNLRTALFNWLFARSHGGRFVLRMEDTDAERCRPEWGEALQQDLFWIGLEWDTGPGREDGLGPYFQSQRDLLYRRSYQQLEEAGQAYPCYCTAAELEASRRAQLRQGRPPRYSGRCRRLTRADRERMEAEGRQPSLRFQVPPGVIAFDDLVRDQQRFDGEELGDFIIRRSDRTPAFLFANAVDDACMGVTHVLRGEDHLTNTPRQLLLLHALGLQAPLYGHISLLVGDDGAPLSKRNGSRAVQELREAGYFPEAVSNYLARLGHHFTDAELRSLEGLAAAFSIESLVRSPARFELGQLDHWHTVAIRSVARETLWQRLAPVLQVPVPEEQQEAWLEAIRPNLERLQDAELWAQICFGESLPWTESARAVIAEADPRLWPATEVALAEHGTDYQALGAALQEATGLKGRRLFKPLRAALTGRTAGPELKALLPLIGLQRAQARIRAIGEGGQSG